MGVLTILVAMVLVMWTPVAGQTPTAKAKATTGTRAYTPPRTADGQPDLQGVWDFRNVIPLERPSQYANREFLTDEEVAEYESELQPEHASHREVLTRGRGHILYEFTVTDPTTWTKPFTAQVPMKRSTEPMYEYACHEGNYGMEGILSAARAVEKAGARKGSK